MVMKNLIISPIKSTQAYAKEQIECLGAPFVVASDFQTNGYGRYNREWEGPKGNFAATFALELKVDMKSFFKLPMLIGVQLCKLLNKLTQVEQFNLKWPNDILINNKKVGGVLIEKENDVFFIGIGLNLKQSPKSKHIPYPVGNVLSETNVEIGFKEVLSELVVWFESLLLTMHTVNSKDVIEGYTCFLTGIGQQIKVKTRAAELDGLFEGISQDGGLILKMQTETQLIYAADIFLKE